MDLTIPFSHLCPSSLTDLGPCLLTLPPIHLFTHSFLWCLLGGYVMQASDAAPVLPIFFLVASVLIA